MAFILVLYGHGFYIGFPKVLLAGLGCVVGLYIGLGGLGGLPPGHLINEGNALWPWGAQGPPGSSASRASQAVAHMHVFTCGLRQQRL